MPNGDGASLTFLHMYTNYRISDKALGDMTIIQYKAVMIITESIMKWKNKKKPMVVI